MYELLYFAVGAEKLFGLLDDFSDVEGLDAFLGGDESAAVYIAGPAAFAQDWLG